MSGEGEGEGEIEVEVEGLVLRVRVRLKLRVRVKVRVRTMVRVSKHTARCVSNSYLHLPLGRRGQRRSGRLRSPRPLAFSLRCVSRAHLLRGSVSACARQSCVRDHSPSVPCSRFDASSVSCTVSARLGDEVVGVLDGSKMGLTFHPELTLDRRFHRWLLNQAKQQKQPNQPNK